MLRRALRKDEKKVASISFFSKDTVECPVCRETFQKEEMHSGGGRLIAGNLTDELRRTYEPSAKYGEVFPPIYNLIVCPQCLYTTFPSDFKTIDSDLADRLLDTTQERHKAMKKLFTKLRFDQPRSLAEGAASYYLAILCYDHFDHSDSPVIKQAICSLRAAWLFNDLDRHLPGEHYQFVSDLLYQKALFFYRYALQLETSGKQIIAGLKSFGPDTDKNYGYDGVLYLSALLEYKYGSKSDSEFRMTRLEEHKRILAKIFGLGKSSKEKPGPLLEQARDLFDNIKTELKDDE